MAMSIATSARTLIAYYTYTYNVMGIVGELSRNIEADVVRVLPTDTTPRYEANNYALGSQLIATIRNAPNDPASYPPIQPLEVDFDLYDNIIIATPLWWSNMAAPMQTFLFNNGSRMAGKNIALVVSSSSSGISSVVADAKRLIPDGVHHDPALWINDTNRSSKATLIQQWVQGLGFDQPEPQSITVSAGGHSFTATLETNATAEAFMQLLPLTVTMNELNGNEKYHYLDSSLPTDAVRPGTIHAGDIMLYGSSCIVIFYETFSSGYSYTRIGHIDDVTNLKAALGQGDIQVTFGTDAGLVTGDVDGDGKVDGNDINRIINIVLGKEPAVDSADVDGSGGVDGSDINTIINLVLGK